MDNFASHSAQHVHPNRNQLIRLDGCLFLTKSESLCKNTWILDQLIATQSRRIMAAIHENVRHDSRDRSNLISSVRKVRKKTWKMFVRKKRMRVITDSETFSLTEALHCTWDFRFKFMINIFMLWHTRRTMEPLTLCHGFVLITFFINNHHAAAFMLWCFWINR